MTSRRKARTAVLQALYESDCTGHELLSAIDRTIEEQSLSKDAVSFAQQLARGIEQNQSQIDDLIQKFAPNYPVSQLALIDRAILRLAIYEMVVVRQVSVKVAINEAVELAKSFGSENSSKFINGVLGSVSSVVSET